MQRMDPETKLFLQELAPSPKDLTHSLRQLHSESQAQYAKSQAQYANTQAQIATPASNLSQAINAQGEITGTIVDMMIRSDARAETQQ